MSNIEKAGTYNFEYAAFITSKNTYASNWMHTHYSLYWVPTCYWDGGDWVVVGGYSDTAIYTYRINQSGQREVPDIDLDVSMTWLGDYQMEVTVTVTNNHFVNTLPDMPTAPGGPSSGLLESEHTFRVSTTDIDGDDLHYMFDWGDEQSEWLGPYSSGDTVEVGHKWNTTGLHSASVKVKDVWEGETQWSAAAPINIVERGDANSDYDINVADAVYMINNVFNSGPNPDPIPAGDANCSGDNNVADAVFLINYVFNNGPPPVCR